MIIVRVVKMLYTAQQAVLHKKRFRRMMAVNVILFMLTLISIVFFYLGLIMLVFTLREYRRYSTWKKGFEGEFSVIEEFNYPNSFILSDIRLVSKKGNIDHVIVNSKGIFVLETKNYSGEYRLNGETIEKSRKHGKKVRSSSEEARSGASAVTSFLKRILKKEYPVQPLIVLTGDAKIKGKTKSAVPILELDKLNEYFEQLPDKLSREEVLEIVSVLGNHAEHIKET
jgi:hypothetical protein